MELELGWRGKLYQDRICYWTAKASRFTGDGIVAFFLGN